MLAMVLGFPTTPTVILMGGFIGSKLSPVPYLVTLPIAAVILGNVAGIIPANFLMQKFGRKFGFLFSTIYAQIFSLLAIFALDQGSFWLFCFSSFALGNSVSFVHQYRFAAADFIPENTAKAVSIVLVGGIFGGILGPYFAKSSMNLLLVEFAGCFLLLGIMNLLSFFILLSLKQNTLVEEKTIKNEKARDLKMIIRQPTLLVAITIAAFGYGLMALLMTAAPLSMKQGFEFSISLVTLVIQVHLVAMYLPSLWSSYLIKKLGIVYFIALGFVFNYISYLVGYNFQNFLGFLLALFFLGIGWNFLFVGGTYLTVKSYRKAEKFKVQAMNDFFVFGIQALGALFSGTLLYYFSWQWLNIMSFLIISAIFLFFLLARKNIVAISY
jgi:MFS family permease